MTFAFEVALLALDPALHTSGAAILVPDYGESSDEVFSGAYRLHEFGKVTSQPERQRYVESLLDVADELGLPAAVVAEVWDGPRNRKALGPRGEAVFVPDKKWNYKTILGMGNGWGRWEAEIEMVNLDLEENGEATLLVERVTPNDWRDVVFGKKRAKDSETLKAVAQRYFKGVFGYDTNADIAEAGCIGLYGLQSAALAAFAAAPKKKPKRTPPKKKGRRA